MPVSKVCDATANVNAALRESLNGSCGNSEEATITIAGPAAILHDNDNDDEDDERERNPDDLQVKLAATSKRILLTKIEYEETESYGHSVLNTFKSKYTNLKPNIPTYAQMLNGGDNGNSNSSANCNGNGNANGHNSPIVYTNGTYEGANGYTVTESNENNGSIGGSNYHGNGSPNLALNNNNNAMSSSIINNNGGVGGAGSNSNSSNNGIPATATNNSNSNRNAISLGGGNSGGGGCGGGGGGGGPCAGAGAGALLKRGNHELPQPKRILYPRENIHIGWKNSSRKWQVGVGMMNVGNSCYLNSTLQALFHIPSMANWLMSEQPHIEQCETAEHGCIICSMAKTLQAAQTSTSAIRPYYVYSKLKQICKHLATCRQEDAHEFLRYLVDSMEKSYLSRFRNYKELDQYTKETTPLNQIFGGYLRSAVRCLSCNHVSITFQHFQELLLDIRKADNIDEALEGYFSRERLEDMGYKCESCKKKVSATKQFSVERAPIALCIQLKRFSALGNKLNKHVTVKTRIDLSRFATRKNTGELLAYRLVAMISHLGSSQQCGHYTAIGLTESGTYYDYDDSYVRPISIQNLCNTNAYIIFYELDTSVQRQLPHTQVSNADVKENMQKINGYTMATYNNKYNNSNNHNSNNNNHINNSNSNSNNNTSNNSSSNNNNSTSSNHHQQHPQQPIIGPQLPLGGLPNNQFTALNANAHPNSNASAQKTSTINGNVYLNGCTKGSASTARPNAAYNANANVINSLHNNNSNNNGSNNKILIHFKNTNALSKPSSSLTNGVSAIAGGGVATNNSINARSSTATEFGVASVESMPIGAPMKPVSSSTTTTTTTSTWSALVPERAQSPTTANAKTPLSRLNSSAATLPSMPSLNCGETEQHLQTLVHEPKSLVPYDTESEDEQKRSKPLILRRFSSSSSSSNDRYSVADDDDDDDENDVIFDTENTSAPTPLSSSVNTNSGNNNNSIGNKIANTNGTSNGKSNSGMVINEIFQKCKRPCEQPAPALSRGLSNKKQKLQITTKPLKTELNDGDCVRHHTEQISDDNTIVIADCDDDDEDEDEHVTGTTTTTNNNNSDAFNDDRRRATTSTTNGSSTTSRSSFQRSRSTPPTSPVVKTKTGLWQVTKLKADDETENDGEQRNDLMSQVCPYGSVTAQQSLSSPSSSSASSSPSPSPLPASKDAQQQCAVKNPKNPFALKKPDSSVSNSNQHRYKSATSASLSSSTSMNNSGLARRSNHGDCNGYATSTGTPANSSVVSELLKQNHRGYGAKVATWDGQQPEIEKEINNELEELRQRDWQDDEENEMDRGRQKKIKSKHSDGGNRSRSEHEQNLTGYNPFQEQENQRRWKGNSYRHHNNRHITHSFQRNKFKYQRYNSKFQRQNQTATLSYNQQSQQSRGTSNGKIAGICSSANRRGGDY